MATTKDLSLICEIPNFADAYLGKGTKFQGYSLFRFGVLSNLLAWRWKTPPLGMNRVKIKVLPLKPFSKCLDIMITHITLEVLPVTIFQLTWLISLLGRQPSVILDKNYGTKYLGQSV